MDGSVLAQNLRRIRSAKGLTQAQLADLAGLSRVAYRNIETGTAVPKVDSLLRITGALGIGIEDLLRTPERRLNAVRFRATKKMLSREHLLTDLARWLDNYNEVERLLGEKKVFKLTALAELLKSEPPGPERAKRAARDAREQIGLSPRELIRDVYGLLEDRVGTKVYASPLASEGFFGLSVGQQDGGPAIVVNVWDRISVERWIFTAVHELGHLLLHLTAYDVSKLEEDSEEEAEANAFASHFLMPDEVFMDEWKETIGLPLVARVMKIKQIFRVSYKTILYRIASIIPQSPTSNIWKRFNLEYQRHYGKPLKYTDEPQGLQPCVFGAPEPHSSHEPDRLVRYAFTGDRLNRLVFQAISERKLSLERGADILRVALSDMQERLESQREDN